MKPWSRYNTLFRSARNGWFLYNALSGIMLELDEAHYRIACSLRDAKRLSSGDIDNGFMELLEKKGFSLNARMNSSSLWSRATNETPPASAPPR